MLYAFIVLCIIFVLFLLVKADFHFGRKSLLISEMPFHLEKKKAELKLFSTGEAFITHLQQDLFHAQKHIHILFYIFRDDHIGHKMIDLLETKAKQGVTVRLLVDMFGCKMSWSCRRKLKKAGVQFKLSPPLGFPYFFFKLNQRNHRKIVICDGQVGYYGGYNIGDEYLGRDPKFGKWRDLHIRMEGDALKELQRSFLNDWEDANRRAFKETNLLNIRSKGMSDMELFPSNGVFLEDTHLEHINKAQSSITLATAYFIPSEKLQQALLQAAARGVNISIIVPKESDHPFVREAAFPFYKPLLLAGVQIFQYYRGFFHTKAIVFDNTVAYIGTANFDKRSLFTNLELNTYIYDADFVAEVNQVLQYDRSISHPLTIKEWEQRGLWFRMRERIGILFSSFL